MNGSVGINLLREGDPRSSDGTAMGQFYGNERDLIGLFGFCSAPERLVSQAILYGHLSN